MLSTVEHHVHFTLVPLGLMLATPTTVVLLRHFFLHCHDKTRCLTWASVSRPKEIWDFTATAFRSLTWDAKVMGYVLLFLAYAACSLLLLGGKKYTGPPTAQGHVPVYYNNGFRYYLLTVSITLYLLGSGQVSAWSLYSHQDSYQSALLVLGFLMCLFLLIKGFLWPSKSDHGAYGNPVFDFYWGIELYPRIGERLDLKQLTNCRFGMMLWQLTVIVCAFAQWQRFGPSLSMLACAILQTIYIGKFFWWEDGYMQSIDIIVDRAGYYLCWGCICFVPFFYASPSLWMVGRAPTISPIHFALLLGFGLLWIVLNYYCDYQRQLARATDGKCTIWFRPASVIRAKYANEKGEERSSLLLASGFWGLSRHCNYVFEILAALFWALPAGCAVLPYGYCAFLATLLVHRSIRDEDKCSKKYGKYWEQYCERAPYRIVPFIW